MTNKNPKTNYKDESYFKPKECPKCKSKDIIVWGFTNHQPISLQNLFFTSHASVILIISHIPHSYTKIHIPNSTH